MKPPLRTGPPDRQVQRAFEGNRLAKDCQTRAYQKVLPAVRRSQTRIGVTGPLGEKGLVENLETVLVSQEGVAA
jgi:hypothetical protein